MSRFDAHNGFAHFVFANEDVYCTGGLALLDLEQYLYHQLKKSGFQAVYFVSDLDERTSVTVYDGRSQELYAKSDKSAFLTKMMDLWGMTWSAGGKGKNSAPAGTAEQLCRKLFPLLKKEQHQAFVIYLDVFDRIFSGEGRRFLPELIRVGRQQLASQKNILVLVSPITASETAKLLLKEDGVFQVTDPKSGKPLCWVVQSLLQSGAGCKLYEQMKRELDERCIFFNEFTRSRIQRLVQAHYLVCRPEERADAQKIADAADYIYCYFASPQLRGAAGPIFSQNERQTYSQLLSDLNDRNVKSALDREIARIRRGDLHASLYELIVKEYRLEPVEVCMPADDLVARKLRVMKVQPHQLPSREMTRLQQTVRAFQTQRTRLAGQELTAILLEWVGDLEEAVLSRDALSAGHILDGFQEALDRELVYRPGEEVIWASRKTIIRLSRANFELDQRRADFLRRKGEFAREMSRLRAEIEQEELEIAYLAQEDPRRILLASKKDRFTQLYHDSRNLDYVQAQDTRRSNQNADSIRKLQLSIAAFDQPGVKDLPHLLRSAQEMLVNVESERNEEQRQVEDINDRINYTFRELAAMEEVPLSTASRYEAAIRALDEQAMLLVNG